MSTSATTTSAGTERVPESLIDLHGVLVGIRWRRRLWLTTAAIGLLLGGAFTVLVPPEPTARTQILVAHETEAASESASLMLTEVAVLETSQVAAEALRRAGSDARPEDFQKDYEGRAITGNVMQIDVRSSSDEEAERLAQAVAEAYVADHVGRVQAAADAMRASLDERRTQVESDLTALDTAIAEAAGTAEGDALYARRADLTDQVAQLRQRADAADGEVPRVEAGTRIVDRPRAVTESQASTALTNGTVGGVLGLFAGLALAAVAGVVRDRPVLREDIAENLGASVVAQLRRPPLGPARLWHRSRASHERTRLARILIRGLYLDTGAVSILALGCPRVAAQLGVDIAHELAADRPVELIDGLPGAPLETLVRKRASQVRTVELGSSPTPVPVGTLRIGVGSVEAGSDWMNLPELGPETLLLVQAGHATSRWLHTVARQLADFGIPVIGVVLVHPDPRDHTDGTLWDGLRTALRGRAVRRAGAPRLPATDPAVDAELGSTTNVEVT